MLPGFIPRLRSELLHRLAISKPSDPPDPKILGPSTNRVRNQSLSAKRLNNRLHLLRTSPYFSPLASLSPHLRLVNSNSTAVPESSSTSFSPSLMSWVGGSLAGSMKLAGEEMKKETWEEIARSGEKEGHIIEDWSSKEWDAMLV